jgi:hypothetical protein
VPSELKRGMGPDFLSALRSDVLNSINGHRHGPDPACRYPKCDPPLREDATAIQAANAHALELVTTGHSVSHLNATGLTPWMRYSYLNGNGFVNEIVLDYSVFVDEPTVVDNRIPAESDCFGKARFVQPTPANISRIITDIAVGLTCGLIHEPDSNGQRYYERAQLLNSTANKIGIGIAARETHVAGKRAIRIVLVEDTISQYLENLSSLPFVARLNDKLRLSGRVPSGYRLFFGELFYQDQLLPRARATGDPSYAGEFMPVMKFVVDDRPRPKDADRSNVTKAAFHIEGQEFVMPLEFWHGRGVYVFTVVISPDDHSPIHTYNQTIFVQ